MVVYRKKVITTMIFSDEEIEKIRTVLAENCETYIEDFTDDDLLEYFDDLSPENICATYNIPFDKIHSHVDSSFIKFKKER